MLTATELIANEPGLCDYRSGLAVVVGRAVGVRTETAALLLARRIKPSVCTLAVLLLVSRNGLP